LPANNANERELGSIRMKTVQEGGE
jgi:hypothetical protein